MNDAHTQSMGLKKDVCVRAWLKADELTESALLRLQGPHSSYPLTERK